ncbi:hypothetical protein Syun_025254 [Stephania yunnanensis]|uniref:Uncharacterized protein n=1 Tax=Stephania yunnanensis TaxID=152371 RepID=A0AAP0ERV0_9MAGN
MEGVAVLVAEIEEAKGLEAVGVGDKDELVVGITDGVDRGAGESVGDEIGGDSEVKGVVGAVVLVVGGQGGEGGVVAVAPRPMEVGDEGVSEELLGASSQWEKWEPKRWRRSRRCRLAPIVERERENVRV